MAVHEFRGEQFERRSRDGERARGPGLVDRGEKLREKIEEQLARIQKLPSLIRSFFKVPSVAYIGDW